MTELYPTCFVQTPRETGAESVRDWSQHRSEASWSCISQAMPVLGIFVHSKETKDKEQKPARKGKQGGTEQVGTTAFAYHTEAAKT